MRKIFMAVALVLGIGFAATGAQAAAVSGNVAAVNTVAKSGNGIVEKTYYRRRYWRHRYYGRRHFGYRPYYGYGYGRPYYYRHYGYRHRYWRHRRHYY